MILTPPDLPYFSVLNLNIHYYSLCILAAIGVCLWLACFLTDRFRLNVDKEILLDFAPLVVLVSAVCARVYYVILSLDFFMKNPLEIFKVWNGGLSIHGAIIGGVIFGIYYFKRKNISFFKYADIFALVLPLGQAIGRWGNFFNSEAFGLPIKGYAPFMLYVKEGLRPTEFASFEYFQPAFLYESVLNLIAFFVLFFVMKKTANKFDGLIFFLYILLYSIIRLPLEFIRLDTVCFVFGVPFPVLVSIIGIIIGCAGIHCMIKKNSSFS